MLILILLLSLVLIIIAFIVFRFFSLKIGKERILGAFEHLSASLPLESAMIRKIPSLMLSGTYRTYPLTIEASVRKINGKKVEYWRIATSFEEAFKEAFYIQSETQEGKLVKVIDLNLVTTGDDAFDKKILVFASNFLNAHKLFNNYFRQRFLMAGFTDFAIEIKERDAVLELYFDIPSHVRNIRHCIEVWSELLNAILLSSI